MRLPSVVPVLLLVAGLCAGEAAQGAPAEVTLIGVQAALVPDSPQVDPGSEFRVRLRVTDSGDPFNGYETVITYDPAVLTFLPTSPTSLQEGSLMTGACGLRFHNFSAGPGTLSVAHVLLCSGVSVTGPGELYVLRFRAAEEPQVTTVAFGSPPRFYNAGILVQPVDAQNASIQIGTPTGVEPSGPVLGPRLEAFPNPSAAGFLFRVVGRSVGDPTLSIRDVRGRLIRGFELGESEATERLVRWDGRTTAGARVPPGVYHAELRTSHGIVTARIVVVRD